MTNPTIALKQYLSNIGLDGDADFLHDSILLMTKILIELEAEEQIGAEKRERTSMSNKHHNGYRPRSWETRVGEIDLRIPKLRKGSFYPSLLEPRRRSEKALLAVVQKAYIEGVSTRKVDDRLKALGLIGIDKNKVSLICKELDEVVENIYNLIRAYFPRTKNEFRWPPEDHSLTGLEKRLDIHECWSLPSAFVAQISKSPSWSDA